MAIDHYSLCPCGNGKKLKFCKCVDNVQDLEKIIKLIEGGQGVAALDRINTLLTKTPNSAWLLAIKGEVALQLREFETFIENASRFLKLKPDNPLALAMRTLAGVLGEEPPQETIRNFYESIAESRESLPGILPAAGNGLLSQLVKSGQQSMISTLLTVVGTFESNSQIETALRNDPALHAFSKIEPPVQLGPANAGWKERLAEVRALVKTHRYAQAETKLRSILRDFPDEAEPLSWQARVQIALLDRYGAYDSCKKLSQLESLSYTERSLWGAWATHLDSKQQLAEMPAYSVYREVESSEVALEKLQSLENVLVITSDNEESEALLSHKAAIVGDEVPAKATSLVFNRSLKVAEDESANSSVVGQVTLYGKQTDKPARVLVQCCDIGQARQVVDAIVDQLDLQASVDDSLETKITYAEWVGRDRFHLTSDTARRPLHPSEMQTEILQDLLDCPLDALDGKTLRSAKEAAGQEVRVGSIAIHASLWSRIGLSPESVRQLYADVGIDPTAVKGSGDTPNVLSVATVQPENLSDDELGNTTYAALDAGLSSALQVCGQHILSNENFASKKDLLYLAAKSGLETVKTVDEAIQLIDIEIDCLASMGGPVGQAILQKLSLLAENGRDDEARKLMQESIEKHPSDPYLMRFLQQVMAGAQQHPQAAGMTPPTASANDLVLPGAEQQPSSGESKLWLPGS